MSRPQKIFLIRHGESAAQADPTLYRQMANHAISLSEKGKVQAAGCADYLAGYLSREINDRECNPTVMMLTSPFSRALETAGFIHEKLEGLSGVLVRPFDEELALCERNYGMLNSVPKEERLTRFPNEWGYYLRQKELGGEFYARPPLGESFFDVALRVQHLFADLHWEIENNSKDFIVLVGHTHALKAFMMMWCKRTPEWFMFEPDFPNASIRLLDSGEDVGYIYGGIGL